MLLGGVKKADPKRYELDMKRWCDEAFAATLEEDEQAVPKASSLVSRVRETIAK